MIEIVLSWACKFSFFFQKEKKIRENWISFDFNCDDLHLFLYSAVPRYEIQIFNFHFHLFWKGRGGGGGGGGWSEGGAFVVASAFKSFAFTLDIVTSIFLNIFVQDCSSIDQSAPQVSQRSGLESWQAWVFSRLSFGNCIITLCV